MKLLIPIATLNKNRAPAKALSTLLKGLNNYTLLADNLRNDVSPDALLHNLREIKNSVGGHNTFYIPIGTPLLYIAKLFNLPIIAGPNVNGIFRERFGPFNRNLREKIPVAGGNHHDLNFLCNKYVVFSKERKKTCEKRGLDPNKTIIIPHAIDVEEYRPKEKSINLFFAGRLSKGKGIEELIKAMGDINSTLTMCGKGEIEIPHKPNINYKGFVSEEQLKELYGKSRICVFPSKNEFGMVYLEAMASGCAVIGLDRGAGRELIDNEKDGLLIPSQKPQEISEAINYLLDNPKIVKKMGVKARKKMIREYSPEVIGEKFERVIELM